MSFAGIVLLVSMMSALSILLLTPVAERFGLVDAPNSHRKFHDGHIPLVGGVSIYVGLVFGISLFVTPNDSSVTYLLCSSLIVALGVADDAGDLSPKFRLLAQSVIAVLMCAGSGMYIHQLGNIFGFGVVDLGVAGYVLTVLAVIGAINAFNMIDGIDGLLGVSSLVTFLSIGLLFYLNSDIDNMKLALIMSVALVPYLMANLGLPPVKFRKVFMGDTGSMLIGFTVVWLLIQGTQPDSEGSASFSPSTALWLIAFPLMDMARVIINRVLDKCSPFAADRTHLHHILQAVGDSKQVVLLKICTLSAFLAIVGLGMELWHWSEVIIFLTFMVGFFIYAAKVRRLLLQSVKS